MNSRIIRLISMLALVTAAACASARNGSSEEIGDHPAARRYLAAYDSMDMADWLMRRDMTEAAVDLYKEALGMFRKLAQEYPLWQSELLEFRIAHCVEQLKSLEDIASVAADKPEYEEADHEEIRVRAPVVADKPEDEEAVLEALQFERQPDLKRALEAYANILEQQPSHLQALKGAVRCHLRMGSVEAARTLIEDGITAPVSDSELLLLMALIECHDQQFDRAIQLLRQAIDANFMNAEAYVAMGVALAGQGRFGAAEKEMKRALSINPGISEAYYNLAWIDLRQNPGNTAVVRAHYNNALRRGGEPDPLLEKLFR